MEAKEEIVVEELLKDETGRVYGIGNSRVAESREEARKLIADGTHKLQFGSIGVLPEERIAPAVVPAPSPVVPEHTEEPHG